MKKKYLVRLSAAERETLKSVVKKLSGASQKVRRAQILLKADAEGPGWTDSRIADAFSCRVQTRNILKAAGHDPQPRRDADSWDAFLQRHADVMWQCDFLVKPQWAITGMKDLFQLLFIHIGTRRIWISSATNNPDANWMSQQAKSFLQHCDDVELKHTIIMRDNDGKFKKGFDEVLEAGNCFVKKNTPASPNLNAFVERAVQTYEHECLDHFIVISPKQLNVIGREFQTWYNSERPHSSVNHLPPGDQTMPIVGNRDSKEDIVCTTRLGGLLKNHSRRAA